MEIARLTLWETLERVNAKETQRDGALLAYVIDNFNLEDPTPEWQSEAKREISRFLAKADAKLKSCGRNKQKFKQSERQWLQGVVKFKPYDKDKLSTVAQKRGPHFKEQFNDLSLVSKRRRTASLRKDNATETLTFATQMSLRQEGREKAAAIVQKVTEATPKTLQVIYAAVKSSTSGTAQDTAMKPYDAEGALAHMLECNWSKQDYIINKQRLALRNCNVFPCYDKVAAHKRFCYPENVVISEVKASVPLQNLLDHTATRLATVQDELLATGLVPLNVPAELISKVGYDSSTRHSHYNQKWEGEAADDSTMLLTAIVPLLFHQRDDETGKDIIVWMNQKTSSTVFCRPLELEFCKETVALIKEKGAQLESAINNLHTTKIPVGESVLEVKHIVLPTMFDGKVTSALSSESSQNCNVCHARPSEMNDFDKLLQRICDTNAYKYGFPVLHACIRFLEYMLNIAWRIKIRKGYKQYTAAEKEEMSNQKKMVCRRVESEMGLRIDQPSTKGGNTNTGNTARRFFDNPVKVAEITGLDLDILIKIRVVLKTLSCGYVVDVDAFRAFSVQLARDLVKTYGFWYMPSSVHQILLHGADTMSTFPVPIGMLSEEPLESRHKDVRDLRLRHTRKNSRRAGMTDLFNGLLERSDPVIASLRKAPKPKGLLDREVMKMLISPNADGTFPTNINYLIDSSDEESDVDDA